MKAFIALALVVTASVSTTAFASARHRSSAASSDVSSCLDGIQKTLSLTPGTKFTLTGGKNLDGSACDARVEFSRANSGLTHQEYRHFRVVPLAQIRFANGELSQQTSILDVDLEDNTNGLNSYSIDECDISPKNISLKYSSTQIYGWHKTFDYDVTIDVRDGKVVGIKGKGDYGPVNCQF